MYKRGPVTGSHTSRVTKSPEKFIRKSGNVTTTKLPKGGCPSMPKTTKRSPVYASGGKY